MGALALLRADIDRRLADRQTDGNLDAELGLARDVIMSELADRASVDHVRLARIESMLSFILDKNVVEGVRRPTAEQLAALGPDASMIQTRRSWLSEFEREQAAKRSTEIPT